MANNEGQYDPRAQAMEEVHFDWRCIVCCMVALSPFTWNNNTSLALNLCILMWTTPHGLNVTSAIPPFICSVGPGNQFMLSDPDVFFAPSSVVGSFNFIFPSYVKFILIHFHVTWRWHGNPSVQMTLKIKSHRGTVEAACTIRKRSDYSRPRLWWTALPR